MNILSTLRKSRTTVAVASFAVLALTLTACGDDSGGDGAGTAPKASPWSSRAS